jgi:arabinogalactan oligomer / maltooligosaccharide transport system permease protein
MLVLVFFPFLYGLSLSFTGQTLYNTDKALTDIWVGFDNYATILADWDVIKQTVDGWTINYQNFYWTAFITICWTVCNVAIGVTVGLGLALCLNAKGFGELRLFGRRIDIKPLYRGILVLPWALPTYVTALIWKGLFHKQFGPINQILQIFGVAPISWFDSVFTSFITGITVNGWLSFPFMMLISLGGLQSISADMYEAARLDGASRFQQFRYITLPSLKPTLIPAIIISVVWTFNLFNVIYLVSAGEPGGANEILVTQAYKIAFEKYQYGYAAAYATVIFIILLTYGIFQNKMSKATEDIRA